MANLKYMCVIPDDHPSIRSGMWVLTGVLLFTIVEKIFSGYTNADENNPRKFKLIY